VTMDPDIHGLSYTADAGQARDPYLNPGRWGLVSTFFIGSACVRRRPQTFLFPSTSFGRRSQTLKVDEAGDPVRRASGHPQQRHKPVLLLLLLHEHD
jgi:hypothetical protein